jgi:hypothetical protein
MGVMKRLAGMGGARIRGVGGGRALGPSGRIAQVDFKMFLDRKLVTDRIDAKSQKILMRTGGFGRLTMKRMIRARPTGKRSRTVNVDGRQLFIPNKGNRQERMVRDAQTGAVVSTPLAARAHIAFRQQQLASGAGKPPHRGPLDLLRKHIYFSYDPTSESVVIAPLVFAKQPPLIGAQNVPELLEFGGREVFKHYTGTYAPHPYVRPTKVLAEMKMAELTESIPL